MLEIQDQADPQLGDAKMAQHLPALMFRDALNHFSIHDYGPKRNQVGNEFADLNSSK